MEGIPSLTSSSSDSNGSLNMTQNGAMNLIKMENPFTFKVGQVFTGFGVGCGLGIGVGRPLNLGAIPVLNQVMTAASGATHAFSGVARHVNSSLKKIGAKNIEAGIGCGVGFGHGFGIGLALKPGVVQRIQLQIMGAMTHLMMKFGGGPNLSIVQGALPESVQRGMRVANRSLAQDSLGSFTRFGKNVPGMMNQDTVGDKKMDTGTGSSASDSSPLKLSNNTRSEKLINSFLKDPVLREDTELNEGDGQLQSENEMLRMVLKHQQVIGELIKENKRLHQILVEDLKVPPSKLETSYSGKFRSPCDDCFECRRKERRR